MNSPTSSAKPGIASGFLKRFSPSITGVLSGFDRLRLRGTLRHLYRAEVMEAYLNASRVLLKDFGALALRLSTRLKEAAYAAAQEAGCPFQYLPHAAVSKEERARHLAAERGLTTGRVAIFSALENCRSFSVRGDRRSREIHLVLEPRKCLHLYHYFLHEEFGLCHVRVQTWFPFQIDICLNGREWLARQMDRAGLGYRQRDNTFVWLEDAGRAQALLDEQLRLHWPAVLRGLLAAAHPLHREICRPIAQEYYWTATATEFATDVMFRDAASLAAIYPRLVHHGLRTFQSPDVMRFLGRKTTARGQVPGSFEGEIISDLKRRPEGVRVKHSINGNSVKMYDKEGSVLRVETTINTSEEFKVYRAREGDPKGPKSWRTLPRNVRELPRRAEVSAAANGRYLQALASVEDKTPAAEAAEPICRPRTRAGQRYRALNPWSAKDGALLAAVSRGEYTLRGLRNRDVRRQLWPKEASQPVEKKRAAAVTRQLRLLRAHGLLRKLSGTHRYQLTERGRQIATALLAAREANVQELTALAA